MVICFKKNFVLLMHVRFVVLSINQYMLYYYQETDVTILKFSSHVETFRRTPELPDPCGWCFPLCSLCYKKKQKSVHPRGFTTQITPSAQSLQQCDTLHHLPICFGDTLSATTFQYVPSSIFFRMQDCSVFCACTTQCFFLK